MAGQNPNMDQFEAYFQRADVDRDGRISGSEAVNFLLSSNLPRQVLAQVTLFLLDRCCFSVLEISFSVLVTPG